MSSLLKSSTRLRTERSATGAANRFKMAVSLKMAAIFSVGFLLIASNALLVEGKFLIEIVFIDVEVKIGVIECSIGSGNCLKAASHGREMLVTASRNMITA